MRRFRLACLALLAAACGSSAPGGLPGGPPPPPVGKSTGLTVVNIGPAGGSISIAGPGGETFTADFPAGALAAAVDVQLDTITLAAPGALDAFRLGPPGLALQQAVTLTWTMPGAVTPDQVTAAYLDATGYWFRVYSATRTATTLSIQRTSVGDFSLVTLATSRDLQGHYRLDSTETARFTVTGNVTLQWIGDEGSAFAYYVPQGNIDLDPSITIGAATCTAVQPLSAALPLSLAEIRYIPAPTQFRWGLNGRWDLNCTGGISTFIGTDFDTLGVTNIGCVRSDIGTPIIASDHLQDQYLIDCSAKPGGYKVAAAWDLVPPGQTPAALPPPPFP